MTKGTIYIVREQSTSDNPADKGMEIQRFLTWDEARDYSDSLYKNEEIKTYISEEPSSR